VRQTLLAATVAFVIGAIATGAALSLAQTSPSTASTSNQTWPAQRTNGAPSDRAMLGWGNRMRHHRAADQRAFALVYRQADRQLAPADVQKIAEAFLLWNGNHAWKITNVAPTSDGPIAFTLSTPEDSVVARFTMDPHSGRIRRVG
jgi:hypothetical protein